LVGGLPLAAHAFGSDGAALALIFGGIHGNEPGSVAAVERLAAHLAIHPPVPSARVVIAAAVNPDGLAAGLKDNARGVDLNRNFPSTNWRPEHRPGYAPGAHPLSEPESAWLAALVERERPRRLVAVHQPFACVNYDGPALALAERMAVASGWPAVADIGYPTPGSFGSCYGVDRGLEVITLELPRTVDEPELERALRALLVACTP
jgi:protein MpaA